MNLRILKAYAGFDLKIILRERVALVLILALPAAMYVFFGMMFGANQYGAQKISFYDEYTPSFTALILLNIGLMNLGPALAIYRELGFYRRLMVTPVTPSIIWLTTVFRATLIYLVGYTGMAVTGWLMFGEVPKSSLLQFGLGVIISCFSLLSMGFMIGAVCKSSVAAINTGIFVFQPMLLLSGASIPLSVMPSWVGYISNLIPMTHVVTIMRLIWRDQLFTHAALFPVIWLLVFGTVCAVIAKKYFRKTMVD